MITMRMAVTRMRAMVRKIVRKLDIVTVIVIRTRIVVFKLENTGDLFTSYDLKSM